jgi:hypothetical protein
MRCAVLEETTSLRVEADATGEKSSSVVSHDRDLGKGHVHCSTAIGPTSRSRSFEKHQPEKKGAFMIESDLSARITPNELPVTTAKSANTSTTQVAFVPSSHAGKYAGYLYVMESSEGPVLSVPGIIGGIDDTEPDSACAEALIGRSIGPWLQGPDGWYAEIN